MPTSTLLAPSSAGSRFKTILWVSLGLTVLFVFITSELLLITDYPMYHAYRLQVIADRHLLIPHTLAGIFALLIGPINFSSRIRQRHLNSIASSAASTSSPCLLVPSRGSLSPAGRPGLPGTSMQAAAWMVCTTAAFITARNRQITQHRQWMARSYAVTFTFVSSRVLNLCAALLEPSGRRPIRRRRHRVHTCLAADRRPRPQLARAHHPPRLDRRLEGHEIFRASS